MAATKLIYDRIFVRYDTPAQIPQALSKMVQSRQECQFSSGANQLTGYYYPTDETAHGLIVLVPGFHAGGDDYLQQICHLLSYGWSVFTFDTTGTGRSQGKSQVGFSQVIPDLEAALKYVENRSRFGYNELILMGHSRGAYAACCVLPQAQNVTAVVSISGVNSAMEAVMQMSKNAIGPVSYGNYGFLWLYQANLFGKETLNLQADDILSAEDVPVLVIHGTEDTQVPTDTCSIFSYKESIDSGNVEYLLCEGGHTALLYDADGTANDALMESIHNFLIRCVEEE
jgi:alpha-beta hydrolase superfamily lysophospholipase